VFVGAFPSPYLDFIDRSRIYDCLRQAQQNRTDVVGNIGTSKVVESRGMFMSCITARGYVPNQNGNLAAPPEANPGNWVQ
jgi:hypothetical protein